MKKITRALLVALVLAAAAGALVEAKKGEAGKPSVVVRVEGNRVGDHFVIKVYASGPLTPQKVIAEERAAIDLVGAIVPEKVVLPFKGDAMVKQVRVEQHQADPPIARVVVDLAATLSYSLAREGENTLIIVLPAATMAPAVDFKDRTIKAGVPAIDLHCDTIVKNVYPDHLLDFADSDWWHITLAKMHQGDVAGQVFAIWTNARTDKDGYAHANTMIDMFDQTLKFYSAELAFAGSAEDFERNRMDGKISAFLSLEGTEPIRTLEDIDYFYKRGVRMMGLTWNYQTLIADTAHEGQGRNPAPYGGLSPFGEQAVKRMNELGILIDISHSSDDTVRDVLALSKDPVVASHSCACHFRSHYRNLNDNLIQGVCSRGGVIGVIFNRSFLTTDDRKKFATVGDLADHVEYIAELGGSDCVALGSDYDGGIRPVKGMEDISLIQNLAEELRRRGWGEDKIRKLYFGNFLRVLRRVVDE